MNTSVNILPGSLLTHCSTEASQCLLVLFSFVVVVVVVFLLSHHLCQPHINYFHATRRGIPASGHTQDPFHIVALPPTPEVQEMLENVTARPLGDLFALPAMVAKDGELALAG